MLHRELRVALRSGQALVAEQFLNGAQVGALFQHVGPKGMTQSARVNVRRQALRNGDFFYDAADAAPGEPSAAPVHKPRGPFPVQPGDNLRPLGPLTHQYTTDG